MGLVEQWRRLWKELPGNWGEVKLDIAVPRAEQRSRAAALLGSASPGRFGNDLRMSVHRAGGGVGPDQAEKLFRKLDEERIRATVTLGGVNEREEQPVVAREPLAVTWDAAVAALPADWSDLLCELELTSSDHLQRAALRLAPLNPARDGKRSALRFRVARRFGYGASPQMTRRCFERLDEEGIPGRLTILHVLSDTDNVATQGPVWRVGGKAV
jgi:hypothetical protein